MNRTKWMGNMGTNAFFSITVRAICTTAFFFVKPLAFVFYLNISVSVPPLAVIRKMDNAEYANYANML